MVPLSAGPFHLDYVRYVQDFIRHLGPDVHVISVCQPTVPVLAAVSLMASANDPCQPRSMVMMGGPIDPRQSPAGQSPGHDQALFVVREPGHPPRAAALPGIGPQGLSGFPAARRVHGHESRPPHEVALRLLPGPAARRRQRRRAHRRFYDEYNAVLDMPAEFYLDTIRMVFQESSCRTAPGKSTASWCALPISSGRPLHHRGRAGRHLGPGPDARGDQL